MRDLGAALADYLRGDPPAADLGIDRGAAAPTPVAGRDARPQTAWYARKSLWLVLAAAGAAAALVASVVLWITPADGTIRLDLDDPRAEVEVHVDGDPIESARVNAPLPLRPGDQIPP